MLLTHEQLEAKVDALKVGQVHKCLEDQRIVMISLVKPKELRGFLFDGFQVVPYISMVPIEFVRYFKLIYDPRAKTFTSSRGDC